MDNATLRHRLRLLLSCEEKLRRLRANCDAEFARGSLDRDAYDARMEEYSQLRAHAREDLERLRAEAAGQLETRAGRLRKLLAAPDNARNAAAMESLRAELAEANRLLAHPALPDLGGFLDLPLESYLHAPRKPGRGGLAAYLSRSDRITVGVAAVVLAAAIIGVYVTLRGGGEVNIALQPIGPDSGQWLLSIENEKPYALLFHAQWPRDQRPRTGPEGERTIGVELLGRALDEDEFRLLPPLNGLWQYEGAPIEHRGPVRILPGIREEFTFTPGAIAQLGYETGELQVRIAGARGGLLFSRTVPLDEAGRGGETGQTRRGGLPGQPPR